MRRQEVERIANEVACRYRARPRDELVSLLKKQDTFELVAASGTRYQIEVQAFWDDRRGNNLRVSTAIDDFGSSAFHPLTVDFIVAPDGRFVDQT